ncbi:divalent-cation tolerance protein CutA isoform X3 [Aedes albopictus]|uniref:Secreted protein n=1 Tax=Aedes albopictus TaxID=7160 RepID=A0ABM1ZGX5_AEDAL
MILPATTIRTVLFLLFSASIGLEGTFIAATAISEHGDSSVIGGERPPNSASSMSSDSAAEKYQPGTHSIAYVTTPNANSAKELARKLIEHKLAACVNIIPGLTSIYQWEGKMNEDQEILLMIKTRTSRVDELSKFVRENHPYSVAEVITVPIENGNPPYLDWLSKTVSAEGAKK